MRVLITGVAGLLGSHLAERLLREGHEVLGVDNLSTGQRPNLDRLGRYPGFRFLRDRHFARRKGYLGRTIRVGMPRGSGPMVLRPLPEDGPKRRVPTSP